MKLHILLISILFIGCTNRLTIKAQTEINRIHSYIDFNDANESDNLVTSVGVGVEFKYGENLERIGESESSYSYDLNAMELLRASEWKVFEVQRKKEYLNRKSDNYGRAQFNSFFFEKNQLIYVRREERYTADSTFVSKFYLKNNRIFYHENVPRKEQNELIQKANDYLQESKEEWSDFRDLEVDY